MADIKITLVKSTNSANKNHCATVQALGLKKIGQFCGPQGYTGHSRNGS